MLATIFQNRKHNAQSMIRSAQLQVEFLEGRCVPSTFASMLQSPAVVASAPQHVSPVGGEIRVVPLGGAKVDSGGANDHHVSGQISRSSGEEIPQLVIRFGGVKVASGGANGNHVTGEISRSSGEEIPQVAAVSRYFALAYHPPRGIGEEIPSVSNLLA